MPQSYRATEWNNTNSKNQFKKNNILMMLRLWIYGHNIAVYINALWFLKRNYFLGGRERQKRALVSWLSLPFFLYQKPESDSRNRMTWLARSCWLPRSASAGGRSQGRGWSSKLALWHGEQRSQLVSSLPTPNFKKFMLCSFQNIDHVPIRSNLKLGVSNDWV